MTALSLFVKTLVPLLADRLDRDERGATAVEYGLMVALIATVIIAGVMLLGDNLAAMFNRLGVCVGDPRNC